MGAAWAGAMCPQPMCLRTMAAFLVSTRPLSPLLRGRLLVCSIRSFSSSSATVLLMNSLPLSEWKLRMTKGNCWRMLASRGINQASEMRGVQHHFPLRELIDGVDVVDSLALGAVALVYGVDAQKAGLAVGRGLLAFTDLDRGGPGLLVMAQAQAVARAVAQVVKVSVGQSCQPLELRLAVDLKLALENMARGRAAEPLVGLVDFGQKLNVRRGVMALKAWLRRGFGRYPTDADIAAN